MKLPVAICLSLSLRVLSDVCLCSRDTACFRCAEEKMEFAEARVLLALGRLDKGFVRIKCHVAAERVARYEMLNRTAWYGSFLSGEMKIRSQKRSVFSCRSIFFDWKEVSEQ